MENSQMPVVYAAINSCNGKAYVGVTARTLETRRAAHIASSKDTKNTGCRVFKAAIKKYGVDAFDWVVLRECASLADALKAEIHFISTLKPEYNISPGGSAGWAGIPRTLEWKAKISAANKGRKNSPETIAKIKANRPKDMFMKPVVCLDDGRVFPSIRDAASFYGVRKKGISEALNGRQIRAGGKYFALLKNGQDAETQDALFALHKKKRDNWTETLKAGVLRGRPVKCINDGRIFTSGKKAADFYNISQMRVSQICRDGTQTTSGLRFMFADADAPPKKREKTSEEVALAKTLRDDALRRANKKARKKVACLSDGSTHESITAAARHYGLSIAQVSDAIHRSGKAAGYVFRFAEG